MRKSEQYEYSVERIAGSPVKGKFLLRKFDPDIPEQAPEEYRVILNVKINYIDCDCPGFAIQRKKPPHMHKHVLLVMKYVAEGEPKDQLYHILKDDSIVQAGNRTNQ